MDKRKLIPVVCMIGLIIFFVWGWLDTFAHSWLTFIGIAVVIIVIQTVEKDKEGSGKKD